MQVARSIELGARMADRVLALVGTGKGPWLRARKGSKLRVSGLPQGEYVVMKLNDVEDIAYPSDGDHPIPESIREVCIEYQGSNRHLCCFVLSD